MFFDMVRDRGHGLSDGRQPLGLHHRAVVSRILDGQSGLMGDGHHQVQVVLAELGGAPLADELLGTGRRVDVDHADHVVAPLHGDANRLADAELQDADRRVPALVLARVAGNDPLVLLQHVVDDRLGDRHPVVRSHLLTGAADFGNERLFHRVHEHDAAAVGLDPFENVVHDPLQQLVDVRRLADRQRGSI